MKFSSLFLLISFAFSFNINAKVRLETNITLRSVKKHAKILAQLTSMHELSFDEPTIIFDSKYLAVTAKLTERNDKIIVEYTFERKKAAKKFKELLSTPVLVLHYGKSGRVSIGKYKKKHKKKGQSCTLIAKVEKIPVLNDSAQQWPASHSQTD